MLTHEAGIHVTNLNLIVVCHDGCVAAGPLVERPEIRGDWPFLQLGWGKAKVLIHVDEIASILRVDAKQAKRTRRSTPTTIVKKGGSFV
jgi:hypothetical protein